MSLTPPSLGTPRLQLRLLEASDLDALYTMHAKPAVMRYWITPPWTSLEQATASLARSREPSDDSFRLGIVRRADGALIGHTSLFGYSVQCRRAELGYMLDDAAWGQGYASEAVAALLQWGFDELNLNRVQADIDPRNGASARLLERLGFQLEGTLRDHWIVDGEVSDTGLYSLLRNGWRESRESQASPAPAADPLPAGYHLRVLDDASFDALFNAHRAQAFAGTFDLELAGALSSPEQQALQPHRERAATLWRLNVGLFRGDELVGWSWGRQADGESFMMVNSAVLPAFRGRGLYSALLRWLLPRLRDEGFQVVRSRHVATNNAVIVPKLKAGFVITGFELSERFGTLVLLSHVFNPVRRQVLDVRAGLSRPDDAVRRLLRMD